jgi:GxxExxY protein
MNESDKRDLSHTIIEAAIEVHRLLGGPGLIESVYESALCHELTLRGIQNQRQMAVPVVYKGIPVREPLFLDILVAKKIVVEVKALGKDNPYYQAQVATYLRLTGLKEGLLIDFGKGLLKDGISRIINDHQSPGS